MTDSPGPSRFAPFRLLDEEWPIDSELLTATAKLKRRGLLAHFQTVIDELYAGTELAEPAAGLQRIGDDLDGPPTAWRGLDRCRKNRSARIAQPLPC